MKKLYYIKNASIFGLALQSDIATHWEASSAYTCPLLIHEAKCNGHIVNNPKIGINLHALFCIKILIPVMLIIKSHSSLEKA